MIYKAPILGMCLILGISLVYKWTVDPHTHDVPEFKVHDCFSFHNKKDHKADGIVEIVLDKEYVVMWSDEAERRYPGPKQGNILSIKYLDAYASKVKCPDGWVNQRRWK